MIRFHRRKRLGILEYSVSRVGGRASLGLRVIRDEFPGVWPVAGASLSSKKAGRKIGIFRAVTEGPFSIESSWKANVGGLSRPLAIPAAFREGGVMERAGSGDPSG